MTEAADSPQPQPTNSSSDGPVVHRSLAPKTPFEAVFGRHIGNVIFTNLFGLMILVFLAWACTQLGADDKAKLGYAMVGLTGMLLGWGCGMYFAPYGSELSKFLTIGQAVSAFASGYLVSKVDRFVEASLFPKDGGIPAVDWLGAAIFAAAFMNAALVVYSNRSYFREH